MPMTLGWNPAGLTVAVSPGMKYKGTIVLTDGVPTVSNPNGTPVNWPTGTTARLVLTLDTFTDTWTPTVTTSIMAWNITAASVDAVPNGAHASLFLSYGTGVDEFEWAVGGVVRR